MPLIGAIIQARLSGTRFGGDKILELINGISVLEHCVNRVHQSCVDKVIIATPHNIPVCLNEEFFHGSEEDVLDRYYQCAKMYKFDVIVRITADCPLILPSEIDRCVESYLRNDCDYVTNRPMMPDGFDVEVFSFSSLEEAWKNAKEKYEREHVTPYIKENKRVINLDSPKLSLDTREDLERIKRYYCELVK